MRQTLYVLYLFWFQNEPYEMYVSTVAETL